MLLWTARILRAHEARWKRAVHLSVTLAAFASPAAAQPLTVHDSFGRAVTVPAPPQRIVPIFASNVEIVASLGLAGRIVGIEAYTRYPREVLDRPLVGGRLGFSVDAVVALQPDLVVVTPSRQAANQLIDPMERIGVPIMVLLQRSVPEILDNIRLMGRVAGVPERGEEVVARFQARLDAVKRKVEGQPEPSVIMITGRLGNGLMLVAREGTYTGNAMRLAGARFALQGTRTLAQVSPEAILNADPDVLLWAGNERDLKELIAQPGWADMRAVKNKHARAVSRVELLIPGPRTIDGIEHLAAIFHP
ncbi:MAG: ABC transporter substrate-binding protein [Reyranellales bacterium]